MQYKEDPVCQVGSQPLSRLIGLGQSIWLDDLGKSLLMSGQLRNLIDKGEVTGVTSNPAIFEKAIRGCDAYDSDIVQQVQSGGTPLSILRHLMIKDVQDAADMLETVHIRSRGNDGFVSLEVSPLLADDADATLEEAVDLWSHLARHNVLIKIPATCAGVGVIRRLTAMGINTNVTLLFGLGRYQEVCEAWLAGLEDRLAAGGNLEGLTSVASFFLSRIDSKVDPLLRKAAEQQGAKVDGVGTVAIASAKLARQHFRSLCGSQRFLALAKAGARPQRLLWASTATKDAAFSDIHYVEALVGTDTISTLPMQTLAAYRDHGDPELRLDVGLTEARERLDDLPARGINLETLVTALEDEGIRKFRDAHLALLDSLRVKCELIEHRQMQ